MREAPPSGTVTFLFTDIEGSTRLLHELGPVAYGEALAEHRRVLREAFTAHGGVEVDTQGDAFFVAFPTATGAAAAALTGRDALEKGPIRPADSSGGRRMRWRVGWSWRCNSVASTTLRRTGGKR